MPSKFLGQVIALTVGLALSPVTSAQPKNHAKGAGASSGAEGDRTIDKQMEWENKVMGDDSAKAADRRKIAAAQKLADESAKNPPPVQGPKPKDPSKEGVRAKQEATIGLPIASDDSAHSARKSGANSRKAAPASSANDALGALVESSLAQERTGDGSRSTPSKGSAATGRTKGHGKAAAAAPSTLDQMFATSK